MKSCVCRYCGAKVPSAREVFLHYKRDHVTEYAADADKKRATADATSKAGDRPGEFKGFSVAPIAAKVERDDELPPAYAAAEEETEADAELQCIVNIYACFVIAQLEPSAILRILIYFINRFDLLDGISERIAS